MIGVSSSYFAMNRYTIFDSVARAVEFGFGCVELGAAHKFEENVWHTLKNLSELYPHIKFTIHGLFPPQKKSEWFNAALGLTEKNKLMIDNLFAAAEIVNAKLISFHPGFKHQIYRGNQSYGLNIPKIGAEIPEKEAKKNFEQLLTYAASKAKLTGRRILIENIDKSNTVPLIYNKKDFEELFKKFPDIGLLFDYGHALQENKVDEFLQFKNKIYEIHLHAHFDEIPHYLVEESDLKALKKIPRLKQIPIILEHSTAVNIDELLIEKEMVENFMKNI